MLYARHNIYAEVFRLKSFTSAERLFAAFPTLFSDATRLDALYGPAFPESPLALFEKPALYEASPVLNEIIWAIARSLASGARIRDFVATRSAFEKQVFTADRVAAESSLQRIASQFGYSLWWLQSRLSVTFLSAGLEEMRQSTRTLMDETGVGGLASFLLPYFALRTESTQRKEGQRNELERAIKQLELQGDLPAYLRTKLFATHDVSVQDAGNLLLFEAQASLIDHYEALIAVLQSATSNRSISPSASKILEKPLLILFKNTNDRRLSGVLRALGLEFDDPISAERAKIIERYTAGLYSEVGQRYEEYARHHPGDIALFVLHIRARVRLGTAPESFGDGLLGDVYKHLLELFKAGNTAYQSAFSVLTLADRFSSLSWMQYVRAVALHELQTEDREFPSKGFRQILVQDEEISPFSAATALRGPAPLASSVLDAYPLTSQVYEAASRGTVQGNGHVDKRRILKYQAKHALSTGDHAVALALLKELSAGARSEDRLRIYAGMALAQVSLGMVEAAVVTLVTAFLENKSLPSVLPIASVVAALGEPRKWPNTIAVALLFELYTAFCSEDGLAQLRFSFEKYLSDNNLGEPGDLLGRLGEVDQKAVVAFLATVWRPTVMRQTILYSGTREIEEARIKACKVLCTLDPENAGIYLEEIKERVKQLEIAKTTTLIDQSRVHVDIDAIRRSLRRSLADSYARYKSSAASSGAKDEIVISITNLIDKTPGIDQRSIPRLLSAYHVLDGEPLSESDTQFIAMFREVTNEFLFGDHGLNAYLSTCVRHGTLSNTLRKPVSDEGLITSREKDGSYIRNERWAEYARPTDSQFSRQLLHTLDAFSAQFDHIIDFVRDDLLQIKAGNSLEVRKEKSNALFIYVTSNLERRYFQNIDSGFAEMSELVSACIESLWDKTDVNLNVVQKRLDLDVRSQLSASFDKLESNVRALEYEGRFGELLNAIARARTATNNQLNLVISWFKRSEVYDRPDYNADLPAHIALNMIRNTLSQASNWNKANIAYQGEDLLPGRTLDAMVYIFYDLVANAIVRSGLTVEQLWWKAKIAFNEKKFEAVVSNNVDAAVDTPEARAHVEAVLKAIFEGDTARRAQSERNSGFSKIWNALKSPVFRDPQLQAEFIGGTFVVRLQYNLSEEADEYSVH